MYNSIIPLSALLAVVFLESLQVVIQKAKNKELINTHIILSLIITSILMISVITYSPLVRKYKDWEAASKLYKMFFQKLTGVVPGLPDNATINIYDLPQTIFYSKSTIPRAQTATYLTDYAIKAWLNLNYPNNNIEVVAINRGGVATYISNVRVEIAENSSIVNLTVLSDKTKNTLSNSTEN